MIRGVDGLVVQHLEAAEDHRPEQEDRHEPDAGRLDEARALIDKSRASACDVAASAWDGMLALRWLAHDARVLRASCARFLESFRDAPLPRVWMT